MLQAAYVDRDPDSSLTRSPSDTLQYNSTRILRSHVCESQRHGRYTGHRLRVAKCGSARTSSDVPQKGTAVYRGQLFTRASETL